MHEKVAEMAASVAGEKERQLQQQLQQVTQHVEHLEAVLATKEEVRRPCVGTGLGLCQHASRIRLHACRGLGDLPAKCKVHLWRRHERFIHNGGGVMVMGAQELEESRRSYNAQKRVLREALATAAEVEAAQRQADEARARTVAAEVRVAA